MDPTRHINIRTQIDPLLHREVRLVAADLGVPLTTAFMLLLREAIIARAKARLTEDGLIVREAERPETKNRVGAPRRGRPPVPPAPQPEPGPIPSLMEGRTITSAEEFGEANKEWLTQPASGIVHEWPPIIGHVSLSYDPGAEEGDRTAEVIRLESGEVVDITPFPVPAGSTGVVARKGVAIPGVVKGSEFHPVPKPSARKKVRR